MKKKKHVDEFQANKIWPIIQVACRMVQNDPTILDDMLRFKASLGAAIPELRNATKCVGCDRSIKITIYEADLLDGLLILAMARQVRKNMKKGMTFTEANKVHIPTLEATQGILKRQTKCDYLGLIKQNENWKGSGYWCLTRWAWQALRGEYIHKAAKYWEGNLLGRSHEMITLEMMFENHKKLVQQAIAKRKAIRSDYRADFEDYDRTEWSSFADAPIQQSIL